MPATMREVTGYITNVRGEKVTNSEVRFDPIEPHNTVGDDTIVVGDLAPGTVGEIGADGLISVELVATPAADDPYYMTVTVQGGETPVPSFVIQSPDDSGITPVTIPSLFVGTPGPGGIEVLTDLDQLRNVNTVGKADQDTILWDTATNKWIAGPGGGGGTATFPPGGAVGDALIITGIDPEDGPIYEFGPAGISWGNVSDKPATFPSDWSTTTGAPTIPDAYTKTESDGRYIQTINGLPATAGDIEVTAAGIGALPDTYAPAWADIPDKPATFPPATHRHGIEDLWPGQPIEVYKDPTTGFWPASYNIDGNPIYTGGSATAALRPTARTDIRITWFGKEPFPAVVESGTGGMLNNVDKREIIP